MKKCFIAAAFLITAATAMRAFLPGNGWIMLHKGERQCVNDNAVAGHLGHGDLFSPVNPWNDPTDRCTTK